MRETGKWIHDVTRRLLGLDPRFARISKKEEHPIVHPTRKGNPKGLAFGSTDLEVQNHRTKSVIGLRSIYIDALVQLVFGPLAMRSILMVRLLAIIEELPITSETSNIRRQQTRQSLIAPFTGQYV